MPAAPVPTTWLVVPIPEADRLVRAAWRRFNPGAPFGATPDELVVAHVTIAGPFLPVDRIDQQVLGEIRRCCAGQPAFAFTLERAASFSTGVVYLEPEPADPFVDLQQWFTRRWPEAPLYGGEFPGHPHVSVAAERHSPEQVAEVMAFVQPELPIQAVAREVLLLSADERLWHPLHAFPLGRERSGEAMDQATAPVEQ